MADVPDGPFEVRKWASHLTVSDEMLMDNGIIEDTRPPVHLSRRARLRWWLAPRRERLGRRVGGWIAGVDLSGDDCD